MDQLEQLLALLPPSWQAWMMGVFTDIAPYLVQGWEYVIKAGAIIGAAAVMAAAIPGEMDDRAVSGIRRYYNKVYNVLRRVVDVVGANVKNAANAKK